MQRVRVLTTVSMLIGGAALLSGPADAAERIRLTVGASHPATFLPVGTMVDYWIPQVNELLAEYGGEYEIEWSTAIGGSLYKFRETRSAVGDGLVDVGWVGTLWESSAMPLSNVAYYAWFSASDPLVTHAAYHRLVETLPELEREWADNNLVFLGATGGDSYHLFTKVPIESLEDLQGRKISTPGAAANGLRGSGAIAVDSSITNFYTDVQTGITEGAFSFYTGILPTRLYEVTPYVTEIDAGSIIFGGLAMNKSRYDTLPEPVRRAIREAGRSYSEELARRTSAQSSAAKRTMIEAGVQVSVPSEAFRRSWAESMPNIAEEWANTLEGRGLPGWTVLKAYMQAVREVGAEPLRDWAVR